jgi:hypothetical protein
MIIRKAENPFDPFPWVNRWMASVSAAAINQVPKYTTWLAVFVLAVMALMMYFDRLPQPIVSDTEFLGLPVFATGDYAIGWIACGNKVSVGLVAFGGAAFGGMAIGGCSFGIFSIGGLAIGLLAAFGGGSMGYYSFGGGSIGAFAYSGQGVAIGYYSAEGRQKEKLAFVDDKNNISEAK